MFNIELAEQVVIPNLDIFALVGKNKPLTVIVPFIIEKNEIGLKQIIIKGFPKLDITDQVKFSVCVGDCRTDPRFFWEIGNYILSALSIVQLEN